MTNELFVDVELKMEKMFGKKRVFFIDERGSATVEATVVVSFFLMILLLILRVSFFLYDGCRLERAANVACLRASQLPWDNNDLRFQKAEDGIVDIVSGSLLGVQEVEQDIAANKNQVKVVLSASYQWWTINIYKEKKVLNPVQFVRDCKKTKGVMQNVE
ncbi:MAG: pilus assembly protein [Lachnospiraceae bacterium]|nr:pilus assembly protein [Lachnospiraceae bacterium]